ncbi:hypothetical protein [Actinomadura viridis]|uniref:Uncharacterized protein n=1 Tax=Actinomadura viridis TaxID=58110 RepID=A0A931GQC9_9ACTN|nr:hypothetical protein [Actinomadura viridis]MBG6088384.1 hypothetical protein [Actinomadura viridis]
MSGESAEAAMARLRAEFGGRWAIAYSGQGRWWAFRGPMTSETFNRVSDVQAGTAEELADRLREIEAR